MTGIVFEGADASGKSTLARKVAQQSGRELFLAGGKPRDEGHMWTMIGEQSEALRASKLVDRVSCISQQVYRDGLFFRADLMDEIWKIVDAGHVIVYCRPPAEIMTNPKYHEWKEYDTPEWKANILSNQPTFVERYDVLMARIPCIIYDWTSEESRHMEELFAAAHENGVTQALQELIRRPG